VTDPAAFPADPVDLEAFARTLRASYPAGLDRFAAHVLAPLVTRCLRVFATYHPDQEPQP
jgi:hypothetical protein